jgi:hypothetical protein
MWQLRLLDNTPIALATVLRIIKRYLPHKCRTAQEFIDHPDDPDEWLDKVLKIDCILKVEQSDRTLQRVAVDVTANWSQFREKYNEITQTKFTKARNELGIDRHWIIGVNPNHLPNPEDLVDAIYNSVDQSETCLLLNLSQF